MQYLGSDGPNIERIIGGGGLTPLVHRWIDRHRSLTPHSDIPKPSLIAPARRDEKWENTQPQRKKLKYDATCMSRSCKIPCGQQG